MLHKMYILLLLLLEFISCKRLNMFIFDQYAIPALIVAGLASTAFIAISFFADVATKTLAA